MASKNTWKEISNRNRSNRFQNVTNTQGIINNLNITDGLGEENTLVIIPGTLGRSSTDDSGSTNDSGSISGFKCTGLALFQNNIINNLSSETNDGFLRITGGGLNHIDNFSINANSGIKITGPIYQTYDICYNKYKKYYDTSNNFTSGNIFRAFKQEFTSNTGNTQVIINGDLYVQDFHLDTAISRNNYDTSGYFFTLNIDNNNVISNWDSSALAIHTMAHSKYHQSFSIYWKSEQPILNFGITDSTSDSSNVFTIDGFGSRLSADVSFSINATDILSQSVYDTSFINQIATALGVSDEDITDFSLYETNFNTDVSFSFLLNDHNVGNNTENKIYLLDYITDVIENNLNNDSYFSIIDYSLNIYNLSYVYVNFTTYSDICLNTTPEIISTENLQSYIDETLNNGEFIHDISKVIYESDTVDGTVDGSLVSFGNSEPNSFDISYDIFFKAYGTATSLDVSTSDGFVAYIEDKLLNNNTTFDTNLKAAISEVNSIETSIYVNKNNNIIDKNHSDLPGHIRMAGGVTILNLNNDVSLTDITYHTDISNTDRTFNVYGGTYLYDSCYNKYSGITISGDDIEFIIKKPDTTIFKINSNGDASLNDTLSCGNFTIYNKNNIEPVLNSNSSLTISNDLLINDDLDISENITIGGNVDISENLKIEGVGRLENVYTNDLSINQNVEIYQDASFNQYLNVSNKFTTEELQTIDLSINTLELVGGDFTINNSLTFRGDVSINFFNQDLNSDFFVHFKKDLDISGILTFKNDIIFIDNYNIDNINPVLIDKTMNLKGYFDISENLTINNDVSFQGNLNVVDACFNQNLSTSRLIIEGNGNKIDGNTTVNNLNTHSNLHCVNNLTVGEMLIGNDLSLNYVTNQQTSIGGKVIMEEVQLSELIYRGTLIDYDLTNIEQEVPFIKFQDTVLTNSDITTYVVEVQSTTQIGEKTTITLQDSDISYIDNRFSVYGDVTIDLSAKIHNNLTSDGILNIYNNFSSNTIETNNFEINHEDNTFIIDGSLNLINIFDNFSRQDTLSENNLFFGAFNSVAIDNSFIIIGSPTATFSFEDNDIACGKLLVYKYDITSDNKITIYKENVDEDKPVQTLLPSILGDNSLFGYSVKIYKTSLVASAVKLSYESDALHKGGLFYYEYINSSDSWVEQQDLSADDLNANDLLGFKLDMDASFIVASTYEGYSTNTNKGSKVYVYKKDDNGSFNQIQKLKALDNDNQEITDTFTYFGYSVKLQKTNDNHYLFVGSIANSVYHTAGAVYVYEYTDLSFNKIQKIDPLIDIIVRNPFVSDKDFFGCSIDSRISTNDETIVELLIGSYGADNVLDEIGTLRVLDAGAAYRFDLISSESKIVKT